MTESAVQRREEQGEQTSYPVGATSRQKAPKPYTEDISLRPCAKAIFKSISLSVCFIYKTPDQRKSHRQRIAMNERSLRDRTTLSFLEPKEAQAQGFCARTVSN